MLNCKIEEFTMDIRVYTHSSYIFTTLQDDLYPNTQTHTHTMLLLNVLRQHFAVEDIFLTSYYLFLLLFFHYRSSLPIFKWFVDGLDG